jgi:hypothetical protein
MTTQEEITTRFCEVLAQLQPTIMDDVGDRFNKDPKLRGQFTQELCVKLYGAIPMRNVMIVDSPRDQQFVDVVHDKFYLNVP